MISIISPAKSMDFESTYPKGKAEDFKISTKTISILTKLQSLSVDDIGEIMNLSKKLSEINYQRFQNYQSLPEKPAIFAYNGDVYKNIDKNTLTHKMLDFAQDHLRIISAFYGLLCPLDKIKAYRLEMVNKIPEIAPKGLATFWAKEMTNQLNIQLEKHKNKFLINIASNEYFNAIDSKHLQAPIINIHFREIRNGNIKNIALNSKRARGMLTDYIVRNNIDNPQDIKSFNMNNYEFDHGMSNDNNFYFIQKNNFII